MVFFIENASMRDTKKIHPGDYMESVFLILAYLVGSIPCGLLLGNMTGVDIRKGGSGNIGATNVGRQLGKKLGLLTLIGDALKAIIPMIIATYLFADSTWTVLAGFTAFLGHCFPVYLKFKGGKGVATALGMWLYLDPLTAALLILAFIATVKLSGFVSVGSLTAATLLPIILRFSHGSCVEIAVAVIMAIVIWLKHYDNIVRLLHGEEKAWKKAAPSNE